jgi:hypothetical protein
MSEEAQATTDAPQTETAPAPEATSLLGGATEAKPEAEAADPATTIEVKDDKPEGEGDKADDKDDAEKPITPEDYGDFTLPEGMQQDEALLGEFKETAAELGLTKEQAQKLVDLKAKSVQQMMDAWEKTAQKWVQDVKTDKEVGGDNFDKSLASAAKALDTFGTPELRALFNANGLGNHPELVRFCARVGKAVAEDGPVNTRSPVVGEKDPAKVLFPNMA